MKIKIIYIISNINKAFAFEWIAERLNAAEFNLAFILLNPGETEIEEYLRRKQILVYKVPYNSKKDLPNAIFIIYNILRKEKADIVHCHLFDACIAGLIAARMAGVKKRIFTRHYATFHHQYFPRAVYYDKFINTLATDIIAISENVKNTLIKEGVSRGKIHVIHHGFKLEDFANRQDEKLKNLRDKLLVRDQYPVIGVISRYFELKGIQYIIPAFQKLLHHFPDAYLMLANSTGNYSKEIKKLLYHLPDTSYIEIAFEEDIFTLYQLFDLFIHVPVNPSIEAFGQTYVEALAAGIPSIFTLSGVAQEFIKDQSNALVVNFRDSESIYQAMLKLIQNPEIGLCLSEQGKKDVNNLFQLDTMIQKLEQLYIN